MQQLLAGMFNQFLMNQHRRKRVLQIDLHVLPQVIKGWDQGILGGDGVPPMLAGSINLNLNSLY